MEFEKGEIYHIYNRGNNSEKIFFKRENYLFFLLKIKTYVQPYCDIIAWCLMPNHFHLMVYVKETEMDSYIDGLAKSVSTTVLATDGFALSEAIGDRRRTLNQSIGIMLRSYTNAIQKQENRTGSLFQKQTKAIILTKNNRFTPAYFDTVFGTLINTTVYKTYAETCFNYIHDNPRSAGLVKKNEEWEFSSLPDYLGLRNGKLVNKDMGREFFTNTDTTMWV